MVLFGLILVLALSFYLLARVCDEYFVESLDKIAKKLKMSHDAAGATLMAVGSSAPELFIAIIALIKPGNHAELGMGTIVGSAIFNILVIIGAAAIVKRAILTWQPVIRDIIFYSASIVLLLVSFSDGKIDLGEAFLFVIFYIIYVVTVINYKKILKYDDTKIIKEVTEEATEISKKQKNKFWKIFTYAIDWLLEKSFPAKNNYYRVFGFSIFLIAAFSWAIVESAIGISHILNIPEAIIALTILAAGTSIPDLISSVIVAKQGRGDMAISNAIGSNIFDILFGLGAPWLIMLLIFGGSITVSTENLTSSIILLFATVVATLFLMILRKWKIGHRSGYILITLYAFYLIYAIIEIYK